MIYVAKISIEVIDIINVRKFMIRLKTNMFSLETRLVYCSIVLKILSVAALLIIVHLKNVQELLNYSFFLLCVPASVPFGRPEEATGSRHGVDDPSS